MFSHMMTETESEILAGCDMHVHTVYVATMMQTSSYNVETQDKLQALHVVFNSLDGLGRGAGQV